MRLREETRSATEAERRQAAIAASAVRIAVDYTPGTGEILDVEQLVTAPAEINRIVAVDRDLASHLPPSRPACCRATGDAS